MTIATICSLILLFGCGDNDVQWNGVSHVAFLDRRPLCPVDGEAFDVRLQAYRFDVCEVRVHVDDGSQVTTLDASFSHDRGPYAVWEATIPATAAGEIRYWFELIDGSDADFYSVGGMSDGPPADGGFVVDFDTLSHAPLGATPTSGGGMVFRVWAPTPAQAWVRGQFNGFGLDNEMTRLGEDFVARVPDAQVGQPYLYYFQPGSIYKPDARSRQLEGSGLHNSFLVDPLGYDWTVDNFQMPPWDELVLYQLHVGTFSGRNDPQASGAIPATYRDVAAHVDHLVELGVNAVQLMPINEFGWDFSAGYNPITMYAPERALGTPDDLRFMIDTLHANGIAVLTDVVWNHFGGTQNHLWYYDGGQIYFRIPDVQTPWGSQADFGRGPVREYFLHSMLHWLEEFRIDGFRMDGTDFMNIFPQEAEGWSLMQWLNDTLDRRAVDKIAIAEQLPDDPWVTRPTGLGGAGFDAQWYDYFGDVLRAAILEAAFGDPNMGALADALDGSGPYLSGAQVVNYFESHDEIWPESGGQRIIKIIDTTFPHDDMWAKGRYKLAQGLTLLVPGIPMIHQGSEWLEDTDFGSGDPGGGDRIDWSKRVTYAAIFDFFRDTIHARRSNGGLRAGSPVHVYHVNDGGNVLAFRRWDNAGNDLVIVANFSNTDYTVYNLGLPQAGTWYELINSQSSRYDGSGFDNGGSVETGGPPMHGFGQSTSLRLAKMAIVLLRYNDPPDDPCPGDFNDDGTIGFADLTALLGGYGACSGEPGYAAELDLDASGCVDFGDLVGLLSVYGTDCP